VDSNADGVNNDRPNLVGNYKVSGNKLHMFNYSAFTAAPMGTYGNVGRNSLIGPGFVNSDLSFFRFFPIYKEHQLQFRVEMFNAFNHFNLGNPNTNLASGPSQFGWVTSPANLGRIVQFGLKYSF
jgi:hypothetical protein